MLAGIPSRFLGAVMLCAAMLLPPAAAGQITPVPGAAERLGDDPTVIRQIAVEADTGPFLRAREGDVLALHLFDDAAFDLVFTWEHDRPAAWAGLGVTWSGELVGDDQGWFVLTVQRGVLSATFRADGGRAYQVRAGEDGRYVAEELDLARFDPCGGAIDPGPPPPGGGHGAGRGGWCPDDGSEIDVMIVYTPAARVAAGGVGQIEGIAANSIASTNVSYTNSEINPRVNLVHVAEVEYTEVDMSTDLSRLRNPSDGYMEEVHDWRDDHRADLVAMLSAGAPGFCGIAYLMTTNSPDFAPWGFSVSRFNCAVPNLTFAHELGHNQGCQHDRDNANGALFPYSYGWRFHGGSGQQWRTVMAYPPGTRIPHFSNPAVLHDGAPTGVPIGEPDEAHNARTIDQSAWAVSNFRPRHPLPCPPIPLSPECECLLSGGPVTIINLSVDGFSSIRPQDLNNNGQILLSMHPDGASRHRGYVWQDGELTALSNAPPPPCYPDNIFCSTFHGPDGMAINDAGQVAGFVRRSGGWTVPAVWSSPTAVPAVHWMSGQDPQEVMPAYAQYLGISNDGKLVGSTAPPHGSARSLRNADGNTFWNVTLQPFSTA